MIGDRDLILPLISDYGAGRLYAQKKEKRNKELLTEFKRQVGYVDCMVAESNEKLVQERNLIPYCGFIISWLEEKLKIL